MSSSWIEEELSLLTMYQDITRNGDIVLPLFPDENMQELDSNFRPQPITSIGAARSGNFFSNRVQCAMYGQALSVMMRLRHATGNIPYARGSFIIKSEAVDSYDVYAMQVDEPEFAISGFFLELEQAEAAIEMIGAKHIAMAYRTMMCIRD